MNDPWYNTALLQRYAQAAVGVGTGMLIANLLDRYVGTRKPERVWMRLEPVDVPPAVIAAAFTAKSRWTMVEVRRRLAREKRLEEALKKIARIIEEAT